jgi:hypothetical protein
MAMTRRRKSENGRPPSLRNGKHVLQRSVRKSSGSMPRYASGYSGQALHLHLEDPGMKRNRNQIQDLEVVMGS